MENTTPEMVTSLPQLSIFSPELKSKLNDGIGEQNSNYAESIIAKHVIIKAKELGTNIGKAIARKLLGAGNVR